MKFFVKLKFLTFLSLVLLMTSLVRADFSEESLDSLAKELSNTSPISQKIRGNILAKLKNLSSEEVVKLKSISRDNFFNTDDMKKKRLKSKYAEDEKLINSLKDFDLFIAGELEKIYGKGATIYNLSFEEVDKVLETAASQKKLKEIDENIQDSSWGTLSLFCVDVTDLSTFTNADSSLSTGVSGYDVDRVRNSSDDWICDFRLYTVSISWTGVGGKNTDAYNIVNYHGGLSGNANRTRHIVGFGSATIYGHPFSSWLKDNIIFDY